MGCTNCANCSGCSGGSKMPANASGISYVPPQGDISGRTRLTTPFLPSVGPLTPAGIAWRETAPNVSLIGTRQGAGNPLWSTTIDGHGNAEVSSTETAPNGDGYLYFGGITGRTLPVGNAKA